MTDEAPLMAHSETESGAVRTRMKANGPCRPLPIALPQHPQATVLIYPSRG